MIPSPYHLRGVKASSRISSSPNIDFLATFTLIDLSKFASNTSFASSTEHNTSSYISIILSPKLKPAFYAGLSSSTSDIHIPV